MLMMYVFHEAMTSHSFNDLFNIATSDRIFDILLYAFSLYMVCYVCG